MAVSIRLGHEEATASLGRRLAGVLRPGDAVLLEGELGAGKTTLARAVIRAFRDDAALAVPSPSYTLVQDYDGIAHLDLWRLDGSGAPGARDGPGLPGARDGSAALEELGWRELRRGIVVVEWPDRLGALRPDGALRIRIEHGEGDDRTATLDGWPEARLAVLSAADEPACGRR